MKLALILLFVSLGSICSVGLAALLLLFRKETLGLFISRIIPYAIGTLLGAAFLGMIPHALSQLSGDTVLLTVVCGIIIFYALEKLALWRHCHEKDCNIHSRAAELILIGDSLHNFVDGVAIAAAFAGSTSLGIATSIAVIAHEVPQEVGDFAILLAGGFSRSRALLFNALSSLAALPGAIIAYFLLPKIAMVVPYMLSVSAASFVYIALADLVPGRRCSSNLRGILSELILILLGVATIAVLHAHARS